MKRRAALPLLGAVLAAALGSARAEPPAPTPPPEQQEAEAQPEPRGTPQEEEAIQALRDARLVRARELAEAILSADPTSIRAEYALGVALQDGEGNIPLALHHYQEGLDRISLPSGWPRPDERLWHMRLLARKMSALSDLGRQKELLAATRLFREAYAPDAFAADVWPLMKLGRIDEARRAAKRAIASGEKMEEIIARNGLCAIDGYRACLEMLKAVRGVDFELGLALRNVAVAALESGRYGDAERMLLESTEHPDENTNAWRDLATLFVAEGRLSEALDAARRMRDLSRRQPLRVRQHSGAEDLVAAGQLLLVAGRTESAARASGRALEAPDRAAHWSGSASEIMAEGELLDRAVGRTLAEEERENAALAPWRAAPVHWWRAAKHAAEAWLTGRRLQPLLESGGMRPADRVDHLRPELSAPFWLQPDAVALFGAGPTLALLEDVRRAGPIPDDPVPPKMRDASRLALETEARWLAGDYARCLAAGARARELLPPAEVLIRARIALRMAQSALAAGRKAEAWPYFAEVMDKDPGVLRRLGAALPVAPRAAAGLAADAAARALGTPRFARDAASPFALSGAGTRLCLTGIGGGVIACADDPGPLAERGGGPAGPPAPARADAAARLAGALLKVAFAPRLDMSRQDLTSLDGSPVVERGIDAKDLDEIKDR